MENQMLKGKVAIITGASYGMGQSMAELFAEEGASVVLIPLLLTVIVIVICLKTSLGSYWHTLQTMYSDENGIQFAQSMIYNFQQELWENNWSEKAENENLHEIRQTDEMNKMEETLSRLGYHFYMDVILVS